MDPRIHPNFPATSELKNLQLQPPQFCQTSRSFSGEKPFNPLRRLAFGHGLLLGGPQAQVRRGAAGQLSAGSSINKGLIEASYKCTMIIPNKLWGNVPPHIMLLGAIWIHHRILRNDPHFGALLSSGGFQLGPHVS